MREWRILCDKCGAEITGNPILLRAERVARADSDQSLDIICEGMELCDKCWEDISNAIMSNLPIEITGKSSPDPEEAAEPDTTLLDPPEEAADAESPTSPSRKYMKLDHGKIRALYDAGWKRKDIADEMKCTVTQVNNSLQRHK